MASVERLKVHFAAIYSSSLADYTWFSSVDIRCLVAALLVAWKIVRWSGIRGVPRRPCLRETFAWESTGTILPEISYPIHRTRMGNSFASRGARCWCVIFGQNSRQNGEKISEAGRSPASSNRGLSILRRRSSFLSARTYSIRSAFRKQQLPFNNIGWNRKFL